MLHAIYTPNFGSYADPRVVMRLAREAEAAGWDGYFIWDHIIGFGPDAPLADPWVLLGAVAAVTEHIRIGALVTPIPRRRPWHVARETVTLDHLSGGRLVFGAGIGGQEIEYRAFGEPPDAHLRGDMLDEGLEVLTGLWSGEPFSHEGKFYRLNNVHFRPAPLQQPRIPVWIAGNWPNRRPFERAAKWDGVCVGDSHRPLEPADFRDIAEFISERRPAGNLDGYDIAYWHETSGERTPEDLEQVRAFGEAGVTWLWENVHDMRGTPDQMVERVRKGPTRVEEDE